MDAKHGRGIRAKGNRESNSIRPPPSSRSIEKTLNHHDDIPTNGNGRHIRISERAWVAQAPLENSHSFFSSGRVLVATIIIVVLLLWGGLNVVFRQWRAAYRERAAYGAKVVAGAIDPLAMIVPKGEFPPVLRIANCAGASAAVASLPVEGLSPNAWRIAVEQTHAMLITLTAANILDRDQMQELGKSLTERVERARKRPETARAELGRLWDEISDRAGIITEVRHPRPKILPPKVKKADPL